MTKIVCYKGFFNGCYFVDSEGKSHPLRYFFNIEGEVYAMFLVEWDKCLKLLKFIRCKRRKNE